MKITVIKKSNGKVKTMAAVPLDSRRAAASPRTSRRELSTQRFLFRSGVRNEDHGHQEEQRQGQDDVGSAPGCSTSRRSPRPRHRLWPLVP